MPIRSAAITKEPRTIQVEYEGETFGVTYNRRITVGFLKSLQQQTGSLQGDGGDAGDDPNRIVDTIIAQLAGLLISWEVLDDKGKPLPPTPAVMETLTFEFLNTVFSAVWDDYNRGIDPNSPRPEGSSGSPSSPKESGEGSPGGTPSSASLATAT